MNTEIENYPQQIARDETVAQGLGKTTFIFGAAHSGTTWLSKLIDSHPDVLYLHEPSSKSQGLLYHQAMKLAGSDEPHPHINPDAVFDELIAHYKQFIRPPFFPKHYHTRSFHWEKFFWYMHRLIGTKATPATIRPGGRAKFHLLIKDGLSPKSYNLSLLLDSQAIIIFRHPCGVVNSRLRGAKYDAIELVDRERFYQWHGPLCESLGYSKNQVLAMQEDEVLTLEWLSMYLHLAEIKTNCPPRMHWLIYGRLVNDTAEQVTRLLKICGLQMHPQTQNYIASSTQTGFDFIRSLAGKKSSFFSVQRRVEDPATIWKKELPADSIQRIMKIASVFPLADFWPED